MLVPFDDGEDRWVPPDVSADEPAQPGEYRLRESGQVIESPDYLATWTFRVRSPWRMLLLRMRNSD